MPAIPCPDKIDCPGCDGNPFANLSAEAPDQQEFTGVVPVAIVPPLGFDYSRLGCLGLCISTVSQEAADLCAQEQATQCSIGGMRGPVGGPAAGPVPPPVGPIGTKPIGPGGTGFRNTAQTAPALCPDGLGFNFTVPAGVFAALTQAAADAAALSYAQRQAVLHRICLSDIDDTICEGEETTQVITASGGFLATGTLLNDFEIVSGALPPGLTFNGGLTGFASCSITGTPTSIGVYNFTVQITAPNGDMMQKPYTLTIAGISNTDALPDGQVDQSYTAQLVAVGFTNPVFSADNDLPDGLSMDANGFITGTPTTEETVTTGFVVTEADGSFTCESDGSISIKPMVGINWNNLVWDPPSIGQGGGTGTATVGGNQFNAQSISPADPGNCNPNVVIILHAQMLYTGPDVDCVNTAISFKTPGLSANCTVNISQDGSQIAGGVGFNSGAQPFVVAAGVASLITVDITLIGGCCFSTGGTASVQSILTPAT